MLKERIDVLQDNIETIDPSIRSMAQDIIQDLLIAGFYSGVGSIAKDYEQAYRYVTNCSILCEALEKDVKSSLFHPPSTPQKNKSTKGEIQPDSPLSSLVLLDKNRIFPSLEAYVSSVWDGDYELFEKKRIPFFLSGFTSSNDIGPELLDMCEVLNTLQLPKGSQDLYERIKEKGRAAAQKEAESCFQSYQGFISRHEKASAEIISTLRGVISDDQDDPFQGILGDIPPGTAAGSERNKLPTVFGFFQKDLYKTAINNFEKGLQNNVAPLRDYFFPKP